MHATVAFSATKAWGDFHENALKSDDNSVSSIRVDVKPSIKILPFKAIIQAVEYTYYIDAEGARMQLFKLTKRWIYFGIAAVLALCCYVFFTDIALYSNDAFVYTNFISISSQVSGSLIKVYVKNNQKVNAGDPLFDIDPTPFQLALQQDQANLQHALALQEQTQVQLINLKKQLQVINQTLALAELKQKRYQKVLSQNAVSTQAYDNTQTAYQNTKTHQLELITQIDSAQTSLKVMAASVLSNQSVVNLANYRLGLTKITAPQSGYINNLYVYPGLQVTANQVLFGLVAHQGLQIIANYKEAVLSKVKPGQTVWVELSSNPWHIYKGVVKSFGRAVARNQTTSSAALPYIAPTTDWIRYPYRFPITIDIPDINPDIPIAMGSDAKTLIWLH